MFGESFSSGCHFIKGGRGFVFGHNSVTLFPNSRTSPKFIMNQLIFFTQVLTSMNSSQFIVSEVFHLCLVKKSVNTATV